jgi:integrase/recombinase XerD
MATPRRSPGGKLRGQKAIPHSLDEVIRDTFRLWRKYHLGYDQTKYVVERVRRRLTQQPPHTRNRTVARLEQSEVQRLIQTTYRSRSKYGLMIKTLFQTGTRVDEFVHIRVEDLLLDDDPPQIHIVHVKRGADRYVPILPALADELRTHLHGRHWIPICEQPADPLFDPHGAIDRNELCPYREHQRTCLSAPSPHSIATILLDSGLVPIDQLQKFLGHLDLSTHRFMRKRASGRSGTITSAPWATCGSSTLREFSAFAGKARTFAVLNNVPKLESDTHEEPS